MRPVLIFKCDALLKPGVRELIRKDLKRQIDEGVVITDVTLDYVKTMLPKNCECEVVIEMMEDKND